MGGLTKFWYVLLFILIVGLVFYDDFWWNEYSYSLLSTERKKQIFGRIVNISEDHFYVYTGSSDIRIESSNIVGLREAKYGETVIYVNHRKDGIIEGIGYHNYDYNYLLYFISFIAFLIFLFVFFKEWKLTLKGFEDA